MKIVISKDAPGIYLRSCYKGKRAYCPKMHRDDFYNIMDAIAGQTIDVETNYLFVDQFNTVPIKGVSDFGVRVMANVVEKVINDIRVGAYKNMWTGQICNPSIVPKDEQDYLVRFSPHPNKIVREAGVFLWELYVNNDQEQAKYKNLYQK